MRLPRKPLIQVFLSSFSVNVSLGSSDFKSIACKKSCANQYHRRPGVISNFKGAANNFPLLEVKCEYTDLRFEQKLRAK